MPVPRECWWLPRPRKDKYPGGFPLHFERKLWRLLGSPLSDTVLHPFGGKAEIGVINDINLEVPADYRFDAHELPEEWTDRFNMVMLDPPYDNEHSEQLYNTGKLKPKKYVNEAVRVCKPGGFVVVYHWYLSPRPEGCSWYRIIVLITRVYHKARIVSIFRKDCLHEVQGDGSKAEQDLEALSNCADGNPDGMEE